MIFGWYHTVNITCCFGWNCLPNVTLFHIRPRTAAGHNTHVCFIHITIIITLTHLLQRVVQERRVVRDDDDNDHDHASSSAHSIKSSQVKSSQVKSMPIPILSSSSYGSYLTQHNPYPVGILSEEEFVSSSSSLLCVCASFFLVEK